MKLTDIISMCIGNLTRRKVRTALTVVGVVVGTCAIMVMISLGIAMKVNMDNMIAGMGDLSVIDVYNYGGGPNQVVLDDKAMREIMKLDGVQAATPFYSVRVDASLLGGKSDRYKCPLYNLVGVYPEAMDQFGYVLKDGSFPTGKEKDFVLVAGENAAYEFRDTKKRSGFDMVYPDPDQNGVIKKPFVDFTKDEILLRTEPPSDEDADKNKVVEKKVNIVGTLVQDWSRGYETSAGFFASIEQVKKLEEEYRKITKQKKDEQSTNGYQNAKVKAVDIDVVPQVEEAIKDMGYDTYSMESQRKSMQQEAQRQQMMLGGLGAISLFVAAIGIANTMIMSIYERTREIGVMKVLGCNLGNIRSVFLLEAGVIGFLGGVAGVLLSYGISFGMNVASNLGMNVGMGNMSYGYGGGEEQMKITWEMLTAAVQAVSHGEGEMISIISPWLVGVSLLFATLVGLVSGFYPANRAVQISALEAIKHE